MRHIQLALFLLSICFMLSSCETDPCEGISCLNNGSCVDGTCLCPEGFTGPNCQIEDRCITQEINCQNGGECIDGICDCPTGFEGPDCSRVSPELIQYFLQTGYTPKQLFDLGAELELLYGKEYQGGIIFYLDTIDGTGLITTDQNDESIIWGCEENDILELNNVTNCVVECNILSSTEDQSGARIGDGFTNTEIILNNVCGAHSSAAQYCRSIGEGWFLPSRGELTQIYRVLHKKDIIPLKQGAYWSSTENSNNAWCLARNTVFNYEYLNDDPKSQSLNVRPVKAF